MPGKQNPFEKQPVHVSEHKLTKQVSAALDKVRQEGRIPLWYVKVHGGPYQRVGIPDYILCVGGVFGVAELKPPDGSWGVQPRQAYEMQQIAKAGGRCEVHTTVEGVLLFVDRLWMDAKAADLPHMPPPPEVMDAF